MRATIRRAGRAGARAFALLGGGPLPDPLRSDSLSALRPRS
jgi:hypothetical protein